MSSLSIITASYAPDVELFHDLHQSVLNHAPSETVHTVVVPAKDRRLFRQFEGSRCQILVAADLLPKTFVDLRVINAWANIRSPWPPIRGWMMQQILKLAATARSNADAALLIDSDVVLIKRISPELFLRGGQIRFYRSPNAVGTNLPQHQQWHRTACRLLGLPSISPPMPDYVSAINVWSPKLVRRALRRVESVTGLPWATAFGREWTLSEFFLYGVYVDHLVGVDHIDPVDSMQCHEYWDVEPLTPRTAMEFIHHLKPEDTAIMISAKSRTPLDLRRQAIQEVTSFGEGQVLPDRTLDHRMAPPTERPHDGHAHESHLQHSRTRELE